MSESHPEPAAVVVALPSRRLAAEALRLRSARPRLSEPAVLRLNLLLFLSSGVLLGFWVWRYTGAGEEFVALLTLGGGLSWLAFALKIIPEEKTKDVQLTFYHAAFESRTALRWHGLVLAVVGIGTGGFATVQLEAVRENVERPVVVCPGNERRDAAAGDYWARHLADEDFDVLQPGHALRVLVPVWWGLQRRFVVAVGGYPEKTVSLRPWRRFDLLVPSSFRRTVILLRPTSKMIALCQLAPRRLVITRLDRGVPPFTVPFDGHAAWLGCEARVEIPPVWRELWEKERGWPEHMAFLLFPTAILVPGGDLGPGERIDVRVLGPAGSVDWHLPTPLTVASVTSQTDFVPQVIDIGDKVSL